MFIKKVLLATTLLSSTTLCVTTGNFMPCIDFPAQISAQAESYDGECGYNAVYTIKNNKTLVIYGKNSKDAYIDDYAFVDEKFKSIEYIIVKEEILGIGVGAFDTPSLKRITLCNKDCEIKGTYGNYGISITNQSAVICGYAKSTAKEFATINNRTFCDLDTDEYTYPSGNCGDETVWKLKSGTLTISGTGNISDYNTNIYYDTDNISPFYIRDIYNNNESSFYVTKIKIKDGVTEIGSNVFYHLYQLVSVELPATLTKIGNYAFEGSHSLSEITIPESVSYIGEGAFDQCESLAKITILSNDCYIEANENTFPENAVIYGYNNSTAQKYASLYNRTFISLGNYYTETETVVKTNTNDKANTSNTTKTTAKKTTNKTTSTSADSSSYSLGDVTGDKIIDSSDAVVVLKYYAQSLVSGNAEIDKTSADVNKDGNINSSDAVWILKYYAKSLVEKNIGSMEDFVL